MNAQAFASVLKNPALLDDYSLEELQDLARQYPYASLIYPLIALKSNLEDDNNYEHYLHQAAIRAPDRKKLFEIIHLELPTEALTIEDTALPQSKTEPATATAETIISETPPAAAETETAEPPIAEEEAEPLFEGIKTEKQPEPANEPETATPAEKPETEDTPFNLPGKDEVLEILQSMKEPEVEAGIDDIIEAESHKTSPEEQAAIPDESDEHSFSEWLALLKKGVKKTETPVPQQPVSVLKEIREETVAAQKPLKMEAETFISPRQTKESLLDDDEMITETLAKIYALQKKYDKAIAAYEKLGLKFPDKKAYFAQQIEKLIHLKS